MGTPQSYDSMILDAENFDTTAEEYQTLHAQIADYELFEALFDDYCAEFYHSYIKMCQCRRPLSLDI